MIITTEKLALLFYLVEYLQSRHTNNLTKKQPTLELCVKHVLSANIFLKMELKVSKKQKNQDCNVIEKSDTIKFLLLMCFKALSSTGFERDSLKIGEEGQMVQGVLQI